MESQNLPVNNKPKEVVELEGEINELTNQINKVEQKLFPFEQSLRNEIADLLIEEQELTVLYKAQKKAKKEKRLAQKRRGKNYVVAKKGLKVINKKNSESEIHQQKEKKRLYKEAMLFVHPDKFSMKAEEQKTATEITTKLIDIYKSGSLEELIAYHAHVFSGNTKIAIAATFIENKKIDKTAYLKQEIKRLKKELEELLAKYTYKVLTTYEEPMTFVKELTGYYNDRIFKLKKRTRKK